jgi:PAS domain S-box-containing protein
MAATFPRSALVLVAAHDDARRERMVDLVERAGNRVLEAIDGVHAVAIATRYVPDLLIADTVLPKLDGLRLLARLRHDPDIRDVPAMLVAGSGRTEAELDDPTAAVLASIDDIPRHMLQVLGRRTPASDATVTLRRALADVRANVGDAGSDHDGATRAYQMAHGVEEAMISVLIADDDARCVEANAAICALSGYSRRALLKMSVWDLIPENRTQHDRRLWERFKRDGRFEGSSRIRRRTGETVTIRCAASANVVPGLHVSTLAPARLLDAIRS